MSTGLQYRSGIDDRSVTDSIYDLLETNYFPSTSLMIPRNTPRMTYMSLKYSLFSNSIPPSFAHYCRVWTFCFMVRNIQLRPLRTLGSWGTAPLPTPPRRQPSGDHVESSAPHRQTSKSAPTRASPHDPSQTRETHDTCYSVSPPSTPKLAHTCYTAPRWIPGTHNAHYRGSQSFTWLCSLHVKRTHDVTDHSHCWIMCPQELIETSGPFNMMLRLYRICLPIVTHTLNMSDMDYESSFSMVTWNIWCKFVHNYHHHWN